MSKFLFLAQSLIALAFASAVVLPMLTHEAPEFWDGGTSVKTNPLSPKADVLPNGCVRDANKEFHSNVAVIPAHHYEKAQIVSFDFAWENENVWVVGYC